MKYFYILLSILVLFFSSCSEKDYEPIPPTEMEEEDKLDKTPIHVLENEDGTYYALHDDMLQLRSAEGKVIKEIPYEFPKEIFLNLPYGEQQICGYIPYDMFATDKHIIISFKLGNADYLESRDFFEFENVAYLFDKDLSKYSSKNFVYGIESRTIDNKLLIVDSRANFYAYNSILDKIAEYSYPGDGVGVIISKASRLAIGESKGKFYAFTDYPYSDVEAILINYSDSKTIHVLKPLPQDIIASYFPNEIQEPRLDSQQYVFDNNLFHIIYHYTKYSGETVEICYSYDVFGNQVSPVPEPEKVYVERYSFQNIHSVLLSDSPTDSDPYDCWIGDMNFQVFLETGAFTEFNVFSKYLGRIKEVEYDIESSDSSILLITKTGSRSNLGRSQYILHPFSLGEVDINISNPDHGIIETWHVKIINKPDSL